MHNLAITTKVSHRATRQSVLYLLFGVSALAATAQNGSLRANEDECDLLYRTVAESRQAIEFGDATYEIVEATGTSTTRYRARIRFKGPSLRFDVEQLGLTGKRAKAGDELKNVKQLSLSSDGIATAIHDGERRITRIQDDRVAIKPPAIASDLPAFEPRSLCLTTLPYSVKSPAICMSTTTADAYDCKEAVVDGKKSIALKRTYDHGEVSETETIWIDATTFLPYKMVRAAEPGGREDIVSCSYASDGVVFPIPVDVSFLRRGDSRSEPEEWLTFHLVEFDQETAIPDSIFTPASLNLPLGAEAHDFVENGVNYWNGEKFVSKFSDAVQRQSSQSGFRATATRLILLITACILSVLVIVAWRWRRQK